MTHLHANTDGKWIEGLSAQTPVADAACRALAARLALVDRAVRALPETLDDPEAVHRLRVATRRAGAALDVFADLLPDRALRRARKAIRRLRRSAGAVRDADVFAANVEGRLKAKSPGQTSGLLYLVGLLDGRRDADRAELLRTVEGARDGKPLRRLGKLPGKARGGHGERLGTRAVRLLATLTDGLTDASSGDPNDAGRLHRVRILGKRLRYTLEVVIDCYPPDVRDELYAAVEELQGILGEANDAAQAVRRVEELSGSIADTRPVLSDRVGPGLKLLATHFRKHLARQRKEFDRWRAKWQLLSANERLRKPAGVPPSGQVVE
jgi:CHAD domain-containing protein